jgi:hypothetical protein
MLKLGRGCYAAFVLGLLLANCAPSRARLADDASLSGPATEVLSLGAQPAAADLSYTRPASVTLDFEEDFPPAVKREPRSPSVVTGFFPRGLIEDSSWQGADVTLDYQRLRGDAYAGDGALRIKVESVRGGRAQQLVGGLELKAPYFLRVRFAHRSHTRSPFLVAVGPEAPPWNHEWEQSMTGAPEWHTFEALVPPPESSVSQRLLFIQQVPGMIDIDNLSLEFVHESELSLDAPRPGNLLPTSSFPFGLSSPWAAAPTSRSDRDYAPDPAVVGPSGLPSLRVVPYQQATGVMAQITTPFVGKQGGVHTFSIYAKTNRPGQTLHLRMGPPDKQLWVAPYQKDASLTSEWKRYSFTLKLPYSPAGYYLARLTTHSPGTFFIDGAQVEVGEQATSLRLSHQTELGLHPVQPNGITFEGKPLALRAVAHGRFPDGVRLRTRVEDSRGKTVDGGSFAFETSERRFRTIEFAPSTKGLAQFGSYRVEAVVVDAKGREISLPAELAVARLRTPRMLDQAVPDSPFGIHTTDSPTQVRLARDLGFKWVRMFAFEWPSIEPERGKPRWAELDARVDAYAKHNVQVLAVLSGAPRWASVVPDEFQDWNYGGFLPKSPDLFAAYCAAAAERYADRVDAWEIWNEPFIGGGLNAAYKEGKMVHAKPEQFVALLAAGARAVRRRDPGAPIMWNSGPNYDLAWERELVKLGAFDHVDIVSYHHYLNGAIGFPNDAISGPPRQVRELAPAKRKDISLWNTEGGSGGALINAYRHSAPFNIQGRGHFWADWVVRYYLSTLAQGTERFFLYTLHHFADFHPMYDWLNQDGTVSFPMAALSNLIWHLEGKRYSKTVALGQGVHAFVFGDGKEDVYAISSEGLGRKRVGELPQGVRALDLDGNTVSLPMTLGGEVSFLTAPAALADTVLRALATP